MTHGFTDLTQIVAKSLSNFRLNKNVDQEAVSDLLQNTYHLLASQDSEHYNQCLAVICHTADRYHILDGLNKTLLRDCIAQSRVFLYDTMLKETGLGLAEEFAKNFYTIQETDTVLTKDQKKVFDSFKEHGRLVVSAPTSFGKTRLLEEILITKQYRLSVIVFPTLALLAEQYKRLKNRPELFSYHISTSSKISLAPDNKYILMLTPERLSLFLSSDKNKEVKFDFFCVDEIYKADKLQQGNRKYFFADTIYRLAKFSPSADFYLIGPYLRSFSPNFLKKFDAKFIRFSSEVVQKDYYDLDNLKASKAFPGVNKTASKKDRITKILHHLESREETKSLIFCKDKTTTQLVAEYASKTRILDKNKELADYIANTISKDWSLVKYIRAGVAYHNGNIPRHIQELIVDAFDGNGGVIDVLACTTTLIEGVNTNAKNIIFFDGKVAKDPLDSFTRKNIEGRAGRLTRHFLGNIYYLDENLRIEQNKESELDVELEIFDDKEPSQEAAIQIEKEDLTKAGGEVYDLTLGQAHKNKLPVELLKSNKFISIEKQIELANRLRTLDLKSLGDINLSDYRTVEWVLRLTHSLFNEKDKKTEVSFEKYYLPKSVNYILRPVGLKRLIDEDIKWRTVNRPGDSIDTIISRSIKFYSDCIEYAWPRYLSAFDRIFNYVQGEIDGKKVDFDVLIAKLEYGSSEKHHILLREAGVPFEIIQKVGNIFESCNTPEEMYAICDSSNQEIKRQLTNIEYRVLRFYI